MTAARTFRLGTRASKLARWQADWVAARLRQSGHTVEIIEITTSGDVQQAGPVADIGAPGVFTKEIQRAVLVGKADIAVHSLKDLPTDPVDGLTLAAVPPRENPADVIVARRTEHGARSEAQLPSSLPPAPCSLLRPSSRVGTGSLRRQAQLRHVRPDLAIENIRGNVDTRLRKLDDGEFDAIVLASAGLYRLGLASLITQVLPLDVMLPAVGQGALGIECRTDDSATIAILQAIDDRDTHAAVLAERSLLAHLRGGCLAPIGALAQNQNGFLRLVAAVLSADGARRLVASEAAPAEDAERLGEHVAQTLLAQGAAELIAAARPDTYRE
ncbi:MAG: hydroxymethylbilane synthase [Pirellulales bacterium]